MNILASIYATLLALLGAPSDEGLNVSLWAVLVVLAIIALIVWIALRLRGR